MRYDLFFYQSKYVEAAWGGGGGLTFRVDFNKRLALKTGFSYELKGSTRGDCRLNYLTLPILLQLKFGRAPLFFINIGPYVGYLLPVISDNDYYFKPFDLGASIGLGIGIPISHQFGLTFEIRNNLGLMNVSRNSVYKDWHGDVVAEIGDRYTNTTFAQIGFVYNFGKKEK